ncbi:MAG: peptidylprolyl isomerase [Hyphomonadaceae bacterium]|nr:peptidylprolyl isomerase [Hyphomonadaceae bacterium]
MKHTLIRTVEEASEETFAGCGHGPVPAARRDRGAPPIYVDGVAIAESAIAAEAQNHAAGSGAEARAAAARALVVRHLLLRRAHELGLKPQPLADGHGREETPDEALIRQLLALEAPGEEPSEAECRRVYEASSARFSAPEIYEASHILLEAERPGASAWVSAHQRALELIEKLRLGADFAELARAYSACPTAAEGGALGQLTRGDLAAEFERPLLGLEPGAVAGAPIRTRHGWHVVRLDRHAPSRVLPFQTVAAAIAASLRERSAIAASARYVEKLAAAASIEGLSLMAGGAGR